MPLYCLHNIIVKCFIGTGNVPDITKTLTYSRYHHFNSFSVSFFVYKGDDICTE